MRRGDQIHRRALKHRGVTEQAIVYVLTHTRPQQTVTNRSEDGWLYIGADHNGRDLEVIVVDLADGDALVTHAMPYAHRTKRRRRP